MRAGKRGVTRAARLHRTDVRPSAVADGIAARSRDRDRIEIARDHLLLPTLGGRDRQDSAARADVEDASRPLSPGEPIEREKAAACRPVMTGAEGERRFDLDDDIVRPRRVACVAADDEKAPGANGIETRKRSADPIGAFDAIESDRLRGGVAGRDANQLANRRLIRLGAKVNLDKPLPRAWRGTFLLLESGRCRLRRVERLDDQVCNCTRVGFVAGKAHDMRRVVWREPFEHARD